VALLAPGRAYLLDRVRAHPALAVSPLAAAALLWNQWLMVQFTIGLLPKDAPVRFAAMVRQQADVHTAGSYFYPFAFPVNAWFAWRQVIPIDRYDVLASEPLPPSVDLVLDRRADRLLLDGWEAPGADPAAPSWWIRDRRATILVPLRVDEPRALEISVVARTRFEEPVVEALIGVEINGHEIGRMAASATTPSGETFRLPPEVVGRVVHAGYNRVTFVSHGTRRVDPSDTRPPGAIAASLGTRAWPVAIYRIRIAPAS
jgi:hypothetical protein